MDLSNIQNSRTIEIVNLAPDSSTASPVRIITSSFSKDFMNQIPRPQKQIDNIVNKIKANNKDYVDQTPHSIQSDSETDYANIITIRKAGPQPPKPLDSNNTTKEKTKASQPQQSSTPIQMDIAKQQNVEHDSTSDLENELELEITATTMDEQQTQPSTQARVDKATKSSEQRPMSSLNTEDIEELDKLILD